MSTAATSRTRIVERVRCWTQTGNVDPRPGSCPASLSMAHSAPRAIVIGAEPRPIGPTSGRNRLTATPARLAPTLIAAIKSP
jgi:hypothetical protein